MESPPRAASTVIKSATPSGDCIAPPASGFPRACFTLILTPPSSASSSTPGKWQRSSAVDPGSPAERAGFKPSDQIVALDGQPLLSIADVQWVLHNAASTATLAAQVRRNGASIPLSMSLEPGWRRGNISWRTTTWPLREMGFGGMKLETLKDEERRQAGLTRDQMALKITYLFEYGEKIAAKRAGLKKGDTIVSFDGKDRPMTESELLAYALEQKRPGDRVTVTLLRDGTRKTVSYPLP